MIKLKQKKGSEIAINQTIFIILGVLILIVAVFFLSDGKILNWIRNLPGYDAPIDTSLNLTEDQMKVLNYDKIGRVDYLEKDGDLFKHYYIYLYENLTVPLSERVDIDTHLYWNWNSGDSYNGRLVLSKSGLNGEMGDIQNNFFIVDSEQFRKYHEVFAGFGVTSELMLRLNGAKYIGGGIYKTKTITSTNTEVNKNIWPESAGIKTVDLPLTLLYQESKYKLAAIDFNNYYDSSKAGCSFTTLDDRAKSETVSVPGIYLSCFIPNKFLDSAINFLTFDWGSSGGQNFPIAVIDYEGYIWFYGDRMAFAKKGFEVDRTGKYSSLGSQNILYQSNLRMNYWGIKNYLMTS